MKVKKLPAEGHRNFDERELHNKMLNDKYNKIVFHEGRGLSLYLVGGCIRDALVSGDSFDRDFVVRGDHGYLLQRVAKKTGGKLVRIGDVLWRIILRDNSTLDFSPLGGSIDSDLSRRDFTINAIAWSPAAGIIDPIGGVADVRRRTIRMTRRRNLLDDPIRLIRAYRLACKLSFRIDPETLRAIRAISRMIVKSKSERITLEFFKILNFDASRKTLYGMLNNGLLNHIIPKSCEELRGKLRVFSRVERIINVLPLKYVDMLHGIYSQNLSHAGFLKLAVLLSGVSSAERLSLSRKITRKLKVLSEGERLLSCGRLTRGILFPVFKLMGDASIDLLIIKGRYDMLCDFERFRKIIRKGLLSTEEIIREGGFREGAYLGSALMALKRAEFEKRIERREEALGFIRNMRQII